MIHNIVERVMRFDVEDPFAAGYGERSPDRQNSRNSYHDRLPETRAGSVAVKIAKRRSGSYSPPLLEPRRTAEKSLALKVRDRGGSAAVVMSASLGSLADVRFTTPANSIVEARLSNLPVTFDDLHVFPIWGLIEETALVVGMDTLGTLHELIVDY